MRLIDADAIEYPEYFYEKEEHEDPFIEGFRQGKIDAITDIRALAPTVDAVEVVHGRWIYTRIEDDDWGSTWHKWTCSNCDFSTGHNPHGTNYCPNCGAKMDGGKDND